jgi:hypothetical protein
MILAADDFVRADNLDLGAPWSLIGDALTLKIVGNRVRAKMLSSYCGQRYGGMVWPDDQWSEVILGNVTVGALGSGPIVRAATSAKTFLLAMATTTVIKVRKIVAGVDTLLGTFTGAAAAADAIRLHARSDALDVLQNGITRLSVTDASITTGDPGPFVWESTAGGGEIVSWSGGDFELTRAEKIDAIVAWEVAVQLTNGLSQAEADAVGASTRAHLGTQGDEQVENEYQRHPLEHSWILQL